MSAWVSLIGIITPFFILLFCTLGFLEAKALWKVSLLFHSISFLCFFILWSNYYRVGSEQAGINLALGAAGVWGANSNWHWDYLGAILALASCLIVIILHFIAKEQLTLSRSTMAALAGYQICLLGAIGSGSLFLFSLFWIGALLPKLILIGLDAKKDEMELVRESAVLNIVSYLMLLVCVLVFASPIQSLPTDWFHVESSNYIIRAGSLGFFLLLTVSLIGVGIFPFHGNMRKVYLLSSLERAVMLSFQPLWGFILLFRYSIVLFPGELKMFGPILMQFFAFILLLSSIKFAGTKESRERIFWLQQIICSFMIVGFFSLTSRGWHGALSLLFFQCLVVPYFIMINICHDRVGGLGSINRIFSQKILSLCTAVSVLSVLGAPISIGFYGLLLVIWALNGMSLFALITSLLALPFIISAGIRILFFQLSEPNSGASDYLETLDNRILTGKDSLAIMPIAFVLLLLGLVPKVVLGPIGTTVAGLLSTMGIN